MRTNKEIRDYNKYGWSFIKGPVEKEMCYDNGFQGLVLEILADITERLEDLDSRIPKLIDKKYLTHK